MSASFQKARKFGLLAGSWLFIVPAISSAHFLELIPQHAVVSEKAGRSINLDSQFTHPMASGPRMDMGMPVRFGVMTRGEQEDLLGSLTQKEGDGTRHYSTSYSIQQPGDHIFFLEPEPYWEPSEEAMIIHYTKVIVSAYGGDGTWDQLIGMPVEIRPMTQPYGLWSGNLFRGVVLKDGEPVPGATVEVEWRNDGSVAIPSDEFVTQTIKADQQGVFSYAMPREGWWGFAALVTADKPMKNPEGETVDVEEGGLIWVYVQDME
jgi:cobalt/nickel transport protein